MIRHVVLFQFADRATPEQLEEIRARLAQLDAPGRTAFAMGPDLGLRDGNMQVAMVADFTDVEAYQAYDADADHGWIRSHLIAPIAERLERCQFEV
jgi:hypothetical protein